MKFILYCLIVPVLVLNLGCSLTNPVKKEHSLAYGSLWEGEPEKAREHLDTAHDNYVTNFLLVSIELSEENLDKAEYYAEQLVADHKDIPDGEVLLNLVQRRKSFPRERWVYSYAVAWREAGTPKLKVVDDIFQSGLSLIEDHDYEDYRKEIPVCTIDYLLVSYGFNSGCDTKSDFKIFLGQINADLPLEIKLLLLHYLDYDGFLPESFEITDELKQEAMKKRSDIIHQLSIELPLYMGFEVISILEQSSEDEPLTLHHVEMLEKAVSRNLWTPPKHELYYLYLKRFQSLGSKNPHMDAFVTASMSDSLLLSSDIRKRIEDSSKNATLQMKMRLANILEEVGKAYLKRKVLVNFLVGISILPSAYRIQGDEEAENQLKEAYDEMKNTFQTATSTHAYYVTFLPITPLMIDAIEFQVKDEVGFFLLLTGEEMPEVISAIINEPLSN